MLAGDCAAAWPMSLGPTVHARTLAEWELRGRPPACPFEGEAGIGNTVARSVSVGASAPVERVSGVRPSATTVFSSRLIPRSGGMSSRHSRSARMSRLSLRQRLRLPSAVSNLLDGTEASRTQSGYWRGSSRRHARVISPARFASARSMSPTMRRSRMYSQDSVTRSIAT